MLAVHAELIKVVATFTKSTPRSFASKYLHFHCPVAVPVYDARAVKALGLRYPGWRSPVPKPEHDAIYSRFVYLTLQALDDIEVRLNERLSLKDLDRILWLEGGSSAGSGDTA